MHEGKVYRGIGVNFYGAFNGYFINGNDEFKAIFTLLAAHGIEFCRINIGLFWPVDYDKWSKNQQQYFKCLDEVVQMAEQQNIGIICSFFWYMQGISDFYDEPGNAWGDLKSRTRKYMAQYTEQIVSRYMESPAIWGYEFGNEINLACDLPNAAEHRGAVIPELGTRLTRDSRDDLTADIAQPLLEEFAKIVKKTDKYNRIVTSGCAEPRPSQYNQRMHGSWQTDTRDQMAQAMNWFNPSPMDCASIHLYDLLDRFLPTGQICYANLIKAYMEEANKQGKALFVGEFHGLDRLCEDIIDAIVTNRTPISAVWAIGTVEYSLSTDPARQNAVLKYIEDANKLLKN